MNEAMIIIILGYGSKRKMGIFHKCACIIEFYYTGLGKKITFEACTGTPNDFITFFKDYCIGMGFLCLFEDAMMGFIIIENIKALQEKTFECSQHLSQNIQSFFLGHLDIIIKTVLVH